MLVRFDSLNRDLPPTLFVCNPDGQKLAVIPADAYEDLKIHPKFNEVSDISFRVYKHIGQNEDGTYIDAHCYPWLQIRRNILIEGFGIFRITDLNESDDSYDPYMDIECTSCEIEWGDKTVYIQEGTYQFYDSSKPDETLFGQIVAKFPDWTIGTIDETVAARYRTFDYVEESAYSFLMDDAEKTYECIFDFDYLNRTVSVYDMDRLVEPTDLFLSYDNFVQNIKKKSLSDEVVTALQVQGDSESVNIRSVNPIGGDVIYNFTPFKSTDWMTQDLIDAIDAWEAKIANKDTQMSTYYLAYNTKNNELITLQGDLVNLQNTLNAYKQTQAIRIANGDNLSEINANISATEAQIAQKQAEITAKQAEVDAAKANISGLQADLSLGANFTIDQLAVLNRYIIQAVYKEDNITFTESMDFSARQQAISDLYAKGQKLLARLSERRIEITIDCDNFVLDKQFETFRNNLILGRLIRVELTRGTDVANMMLLGFELNYSTRELSLEFGNRYRLMDAYSKYQDLYGRTTSTSNTVSWNKSDWSYGKRSGKIDQMSEFMNSSLDLSKNAIVNSTNEAMTIDDTGLTGRTKSEDGEVDPEQIKIVHNAIAFTTDNWQTSAMAIGKLYFPDGTSGFGINAKYLIGDIILGHSMKISNASGSFSIDESGLHSEQLDRIETALDESKILIVNLSRDNVVVFVDSSGSVDLTDASVQISCKIGSIDRTAAATYGFSLVGLTGNWDSTNHIYTIASMSATTGYVTITVTVDGQTVQKRFTVIQVKNGQNGTNGADGQPGKDGEDGKPGKDGENGTNGIGITSTVIEYQQGDSGIANPTGNWSTTIPDVPAGKYLWTRVTYIYSDKSTHEVFSVSMMGKKGSDGKNGTDGTNGVDGVGITNTTIEYQKATSGTETPTGSWFTTIPAVDAGEYLWTRITYTYSDSSTHIAYSVSMMGQRGLDGLQGKDGTDGIDGKPGTDGQTSYFHIKYSPVASPTAAQMTETPSTYIGTYVDFTPTDSDDPDDYTWARFEGIQGKDGADGIPGANGIDGKTQYLHIAYATSADGSTGFSTTSSAGKTYIGTCVDFDVDDPTTAASYKWSKIKGETGADGAPGKDGTDGKDGSPGTDGISVISLTAHYAASDSGETPPTDGWSDTMPERDDTQYLWGYYTVLFSDGTTQDTVPYVVAGAGETYTELTGQLQRVEHEYQTKIEQTKAEILQTASETYATAETVSKLESKVEQTAQQIEFRFTDANGRIQDVSDALSSNQKLLEEYIRFKGALMELGRSDSDFIAKLSNERLSFFEGSNEIAYISNNALNITDAQIRRRLSISYVDDSGEIKYTYDWIVRSNGHITLTRRR